MEAEKTTNCRRCGSLRARVITGGPVQWLVAALLRQEVISCGRCGWRGRQFRLRGRAARGQVSTSLPAQESQQVDFGAIDRDMSASSGAPPLTPGK